MEWLGRQEPVVQAAIIAGVLTILSAIVTAVSTATSVWLRDGLARRSEAMKARDAVRVTYRRYAEPLTAAAASLFWRLREVFELQRGDYLSPGGGVTRFENYKVMSTRYRIAALLGWIRALRQELLLVDARADPTVEKMREAVERVEAALAEGGHVEADRVSLLDEVWELKLSKEDAQRLAGKVDAVIKRALHTANLRTTLELSQTDQQALVGNVATVVEDILQRRIAGAIRRETETEAVVRALSTREAWLYRDWQAAIGDLMLEGAAVGPRRFDVRGYGWFEDLVESGSLADGRWVQRLSDLTDGLVATEDPRRDARIGQLKEVFLAVARLVVDFHEAEPERSSVGAATVEAVRASLASELTA